MLATAVGFEKTKTLSPMPPAKGAAAFPGEARHSVLVVDDDPSFARTVADALCDRDIEALAFNEPRLALDRARQVPFAAAVVDLVMPDMDGLELARELHKTNPSTEVVLLTGHADMRSAVDGIRNELFDYLQKEALQSIRLRRAVRAAIARSEMRAENRRLVAGLQESTRRLKSLAEVSTALSGEQHLDQLLQETVRSAKALFEAEAARVVLFDRNELGDRVMRAAFGDGDAVLAGHFGPGDGIATEVAETRRAVRADVARDHPNFSARCDDMGTALPGLLCAPLIRRSLDGALTVAGRARPFTGDDVALLESLAQQAAIAIENAQAREVNQNFLTHASDMLVSLLDSQDVHYAGHSHNVAALADMVSRRLGLPEEERRTIHFAALLHDVGKLRLGPGVLSSTGPLSEEESRLMREHPTLGVELLRPITRWAALPAVIVSHHERWDGQGYPRGLVGAEIPLGGRIVAVAEAFEAMTRATPHGRRRTVDEALEEIERCAGTQFDPAIARLFAEEYRAHRQELATGRR
ncbi:MAG TPA: HD domain-containing phosphohydrolase [Vicinamibacteria bacterium]|nr:HD domain-containing phosphohydrolase [Vicinamibacteria bacterium]